MTTFQAIIYGVIHGFSEFLPVGRSAHDLIAPYLFHWPMPQGAFLGALSLGTLLSILVYFRHDWASILSCFLQACLFRKRLMTLDERMPLFLAITAIPLIGAEIYLSPLLREFEWTPLRLAAALVAFSIPLWMAESTSRKIKGMFDWNWLDAFLVGLTQAFAIIPGCGLMAGLLTGALFRNYNRESSAKYAFFAITPIIAVQTATQLRGVSTHSVVPAEGISWLTFNMSIIVTFLVGLLAIGGFMRQVQKKSLKPYLLYRWLLAVILLIIYWIRNPSM